MIQGVSEASAVSVSGLGDQRPYMSALFLAAPSVGDQRLALMSTAMEVEARDAVANALNI